MSTLFFLGRAAPPRVRRGGVVRSSNSWGKELSSPPPPNAYTVLLEGGKSRRGYGIGYCRRPDLGGSGFLLGVLFKFRGFLYFRGCRLHSGFRKKGGILSEI